MVKRTIWVATVLGVFLGEAKAGPIYNDATDWSGTNNPNGVWSYGQLSPGASPVASTFSLYPSETTNVGTDIQEWLNDSAHPQPPNDEYNTLNTAVSFVTATLQGQEAAFHPGPNGEYSVFRFTTPSTGSYNVSAKFTGDDHIGPVAADPVYVLDNGTIVFSGSVQAYLSTASYANTLNLNAGDTVDFVVGDTTFGRNTTGLDATLTSAVPGPSSLALLGTAAVTGLGYLGWRRRRKLATA